METENKKKSLLEDLPFYSFVGILALSLAGLIVYIIWAMIAG